MGNDGAKNEYGLSQPLYKNGYGRVTSGVVRTVRPRWYRLRALC